MNIEMIRKELEGYTILRDNENLGKRLILLALAGSHAYGTNNENSDIDIRGCALNGKSDILLGRDFEQIEDKTTDTVIYSFNKMVKLLTNTNPNNIEILGCRKEHYFYISPIGQELLDNKEMFLSKRVVHSFGGYAEQQLRRLQNALARDSYPQAEKERHILGTINSVMFNFQEKYTDFENGAVKLYIDKAENPELDEEIFMDADLKHYPLRDYKNMWSEMHSMVKIYGKLGKRNSKKDDAHLNKHAMHLIRLYMMCTDILEKKEINTYREEERDLLLSIRNGKYQKEDGTYRSEFFDMVNDYMKRVEYAAENTDLPDKPDYRRIDEFVMSVNERIIKNEI